MELEADFRHVEILEGTCETDAAAEHQEHASPQTSGAVPEGEPEMLGRVQQTS